MKKRIFTLMTILCLCLIGIDNVNADTKYVLKDDIPNSTYVIGKYMFTRTPNATYNYDGELTTPEIMLAAKTINGGIDRMIIYYKKINGAWINGLTGESITPPSYFEIENRNLRDILPKPELDHYVELSNTAFNVSDYVNGVNRNKMGSAGEENQFEIYILKNSNGQVLTYPVNDVDAEIAYLGVVAEKIPNYYGTVQWYDEYDGVYQLASRTYYMDGDEKVYSPYSNAVSTAFENSTYYKQGKTSELPQLEMRYSDITLHTDSMSQQFIEEEDVKYYNMEFRLGNVDTSKYKVIKYEIYTDNNSNELTEDDVYAINNLENSSMTYFNMWYDNIKLSKYNNKHFINGKDAYLVSAVYGNTILLDTVDISNELTHSIRLEHGAGGDGTKISHWYSAKITICNLYDESDCFSYYTNWNRIALIKSSTFPTVLY